MAIKTFTTGEVLTASDTNTYLANSGLVYVGGALATSGTNIDVPNCFSAAYDSYRVVISDYRTGAASGINVQLLASGTPTTTGYYYAYVNMGYANSTTYNQKGASNTTFISAVVVNGGSVAGGSAFDVYNPFLSRRTVFQYTRTDSRAGTGEGGPGMGFLDNDTSYNGIRLSSDLTIVNCRVAVYGYRQA